MVALQILLLYNSITLASIFIKIFSYKENREGSGKGTILLTGGKMTKALQLARLLKRSGYKIILVEDRKYWASGHAWSNFIDSFYLLPSISDGYHAYEEAMLSIVEKEQVKR